MAKGSFTQIPEIKPIGSSADVLNILVCQIKVWKAKGTDWFNIPPIDKCLVLNECESIEINNSYKELIGKAVLKIPKGTIISKITKSEKNVSTGNYTEQLTETDVSESTANGQLLTPDSLIYEDGSSTLPIKAVRSHDVDYGVIVVSRSSTDKLASTDDFAMGSRIQIKTGYVTNQERADEIRFEDNPPELELVFTGFITGCSAGTPLEVECENMASLLKKVSCPKTISKRDMSVNDFFGGTYDLLKDTGLQLSPISVETNINVGRVNLDANLTVADVLTEWGKSGIVCFMEPSGKYIRIGRVLYSGLGGDKMPNSDKEYLSYSDNNSYQFIRFDWDVANDGLSIVHHDKRFLAVKAVGFTKDNKSFNLTVRAKPDKEFDSDDDYEVLDNVDDVQVVNERVVRKKKDKVIGWGKKRIPQDGTVSESKRETKVDMSKYTVVPYISKKIGVTREELIKEANDYRKKYTPNGISGTITLFGDVEIHPSEVVGLLDYRNPQKNGYYLVESVDIDFGVGGYRKKIKVPYKIMNYKDIKVSVID